MAVDDGLDLQFQLAAMTATTPRAFKPARMKSASYLLSASRTRSGGAGAGSPMTGAVAFAIGDLTAVQRDRDRLAKSVAAERWMLGEKPPQELRRTWS